MKKNTILPNFTQKFISPKGLDLLEKAVGYDDTARKMDVMTLIQYLITAAAYWTLSCLPDSSIPIQPCI